MKTPRFFASAVLTAGASALLIACSGGYDPSDAVERLNRTANAELQKGLKAAGVKPEFASKAGLTLSCPTDVEKETPFTCTLTGKESGKTIDIEMKINDQDELDAVKAADFNKALERITTVEASIEAKKSFSQGA